MFQPNLMEGRWFQQFEMAPNNPDEELAHYWDDEFDRTKSGNENQEGNSGDNDHNPPPRKKRHHRHTLHQIQELEAFFKMCPHPDNKQRKKLSRQLELEPSQVKFWFQNKRTQTKTHVERYENSKLRAKNEKLMTDNIKYRAALSNSSCPNCGGSTLIGEISLEEHQLWMENARLREEVRNLQHVISWSGYNN